MTLPLAVTLAELRSPLEKSYRNTAYCSATLSQENGKVTGTYCGNRWCLVCNRIRTARAITRYLPVLETWRDKYFVTLTLRNVPATELRATMAGMVADFQAIKLGMRRTDKIKLIALRKLECTYNARTDEYHPHFHVVVEGQAAARLLRKRWLERHQDTATGEAQDVRKADDDSVGELFKYFTKLLTKTRHKTADGKVTSAPVPAPALDVIFRCMKGRRVYQPVGFKVAADAVDDEAEIELDEGTAAPVRADEVVTWVWSQGATDWVSQDTGEVLTGYEPAVKFRDFVDSINPAQKSLSLPVVRPMELAPAEGLDEGKVAAEMRASLLSRPVTGCDAYTAEFVSETVQKLLRLSAEKAAIVAYQVTRCDIGHQLALLPASAIRPPTFTERIWQQQKRRVSRRESLALG